MVTQTQILYIILRWNSFMKKIEQNLLKEQLKRTKHSLSKITTQLSAQRKGQKNS